ncbi:unnamed protein product [Rhizophagus irregularis]|nr:unnamed protein product [Rhizophagus irregularis]
MAYLKIYMKIQLKINSYNDLIFEWIPYNQFNEIKLIGEGGFAKVYLAIWKDGPLEYDKSKNKKPKRGCYKMFIYCNSQNITKDFLNEVKAYSIKNYNDNNILIYMEYLNIQKQRILLWFFTMQGLKDIHQSQIVHRDFHTGNILLNKDDNITLLDDIIYISDMGLCGEVTNTDEANVYGVMPL